MAKSTAKIMYYCTACGHESAKWFGKCPGCGGWNTFEEQPAVPKTAARDKGGMLPIERPAPSINEIEESDEVRLGTGIGELDRVLGGGAVPGALVLVGGDPGIGKSTLLLQAAANLANDGQRVLYVSGEESVRQIKMRATRLGIRAENLHVFSQTDMDRISAQQQTLKPDFMIVDSVQTIYSPSINSMAGSVSQVRGCTGELMRIAKDEGCTVFLVGHVTKEGALAGPRVLEHMVDAVLSFEGDRRQEYRVLRAAKNRFGSVNEIGVFRMGDKGMVEVPNPSEFFLSERTADCAGSVVACAMEGTRPVLVDLQALVSPTMLPAPRRQSYGFDHNRMALLLAVMEKRAGMKLYNMDAYVNVAGGIELDEPAADLPLVAAVASSLSNLPVRPGMVFIGEVGLSGEIRAVSQLERRLIECARMGFTDCVIPQGNLRGEPLPQGLRVHAVRSVREALACAFAK